MADGVLVCVFLTIGVLDWISLFYEVFVGVFIGARVLFGVLFVVVSDWWFGMVESYLNLGHSMGSVFIGADVLVKPS